MIEDGIHAIVGPRRSGRTTQLIEWAKKVRERDDVEVVFVTHNPAYIEPELREAGLWPCEVITHRQFKDGSNARNGAVYAVDDIEGLFPDLVVAFTAVSGSTTVLSSPAYERPKAVRELAGA